MYVCLQVCMYKSINASLNVFFAQIYVCPLHIINA